MLICCNAEGVFGPGKVGTPAPGADTWGDARDASPHQT